MDLAKLYETQISFTEWMEKIQHAQTEAMRTEDNEKRERLKILHEIIRLPYDAPTQFPASEIAVPSLRFQQFLAEHGQELCALRLIPLRQDLPKLRLRGKTVRDVLTWFTEQKIDPELYKADFVPHEEKYQWSTIFIVNQQGIFGEIIQGGHYQLTQGFYEQHQPLFFSYNFKEWQLSSPNPEALQQLQGIISKLQVSDLEFRHTIQQQLNATFAQNYLCGYFETVSSLSQGLWFIDYNRLLGESYADFSLTLPSQDALVKGMSACQGKATGMVRIISAENLASTVLQQGDILVCDMTTPVFVPLMQRAAAIVTDRGGILSHAAIISRELKIPCITGTTNATKILKEGSRVEVDAEKGIVRVLD